MSENNRFEVWEIEPTMITSKSFVKNRSKKFNVNANEENWLEITDNGMSLNQLQVCDLLNKLSDENNKLKKEVDYWKGVSCSNSNFNNILVHELDIAREQGYEVSNPFKKLMEKR